MDVSKPKVQTKHPILITLSSFLSWFKTKYPDDPLILPFLVQDKIPVLMIL